MSFDVFIHKKGRDVLFMDKPYGISTHASDIGRLGFAEAIQSSLGQKVYVSHRLDKTTSGCMVFALSAARAEELRIDFASRSVKKVYLLVTDRKSEQAQHHVVTDDGSETHFERVKRSPFFELWKAEPLSGKTHQIRKHAAQIGLPLLGDSTYGGTSFPVICLHAQKLEIPGEEPFECPPPRYFERLGLLKDPVLVSWLNEIDRRQRLFGFLGKKENMLRLVSQAELNLDDLGEVIIASWYGKALNEKDLNRFHFIGSLLGKPLLIQPRINRGEDPNSNPQIEIGDVPQEWTGTENEIIYRLARNRGLSFGIFLDQRLNREWVRKHSQGANVLNLFAYTGGFSVAAALGGASKVFTVDISAKYLNWTKDNFALNGVSLDPHLFIAADALDFLKRAQKKGEVYDLVICDPPSFARTDSGVFKLDKSMDDLIKSCLAVVKPKAYLLFSCNLETVSAENILRRIKTLSPGSEVVQQTSSFDTHWEDSQNPMKAFLIRTGHPRL